MNVCIHLGIGLNSNNNTSEVRLGKIPKDVMRVVIALLDGENLLALRCVNSKLWPQLSPLVQILTIPTSFQQSSFPPLFCGELDCATELECIGCNKITDTGLSALST